MTDTWWMIERDDLLPAPHYYRWVYKPGQLPKTWPKGFHDWTPDWSQGEKFPTREAAEPYANSDGLRICEHGMMEPRRSVSSADLIAKLHDPRIAAAVNDKGGGRGA